MSTKEYKLNPQFERQVVCFCCANARFWGRIGYAILPEGLEDPTNKLVLQACVAVHTDTSRAPGLNPILVIQRIQRWYDNGKLTYESLEDAEDLISRAQTEISTLDEEMIVSELKPVLKRHMEKEALEAGVDAYAKHRDMGSLVKILNKVSSLGDVDTSLGVHLNRDIVKLIVEEKAVERLPSGIPELDAVLKGGLPRGEWGLFVGGTGSGKSMALSGAASHALSEGLNVAYATLELQEPDVYARIVAGLVEVPTESIISMIHTDVAQERLDMLLTQGRLGWATVKFFTPNITTLLDIEEWIREEEEAAGSTIDVIVIDYVELIGAVNKQAAHHVQLKETSEGLLSLVRKRKCWLWTAAQAQRSKSKERKDRVIDTDDTAGSMGIPRTSPLMISVNAREDDELVLNVAKNRFGKKVGALNPIKHDFAYGRLAAPSRADWPFGCYNPEDEELCV